jgi:hypothetical protein
MVFDRSPDEMFRDATQNAVDVLKTAIEGAKSAIGEVSDIIKTGDNTLRDLDDALTGGRPRFGEMPQETFMNVLEMLHGTLEDAREKQSATSTTVVQKARSILNRINDVEPPWRQPPMGMNTVSDVFRAALRDLRGSQSLIKLAQGQGSLDDLKGLSEWADDLKGRLSKVEGAAESMVSPAQGEAPKAKPAAEKTKPKAKRAKKDTTPKKKGDPKAVAFAQAVAEEYGDDKVKGWAQDFAEGKISESQWVSRLTSHAAASRNDIDDVVARAEARMAREQDANG